MPEIVSINQTDQFVGNHTAYACGFFAVMMCTSMAPPGHEATKAPLQISNDALDAYARYNGDAGAGNSAGMSLPQLYSLLHEVGLHYQGTVLDLAHIRACTGATFPYAGRDCSNVLAARQPFARRAASSNDKQRKRLWRNSTWQQLVSIANLFWTASATLSNPANACGAWSSSA